MATITRARWIKLDAFNRCWRTFMQTGGAAIFVAIGDALWQGYVAHNGAHFDWKRTTVVAGLAALLSYAHRRWLDPSVIPSATPPPEPLPPRLPSPPAPRNER